MNKDLIILKKMTALCKAKGFFLQVITFFPVSLENQRDKTECRNKVEVGIASLDQ